MIQQDAFFGVSGKVRAACDCGMCAPNNIDWTKLTNTEKMVKAMILKAQITAEIQDAVKQFILCIIPFYSTNYTN